MAIFIALHSGSPGVEFFCRQFPDMAKELAHTFEKETNYPVSLTKA
jgi:hypothetical protein